MLATLLIFVGIVVVVKCCGLLPSKLPGPEYKKTSMGPAVGGICSQIIKELFK